MFLSDQQIAHWSDKYHQVRAHRGGGEKMFGEVLKAVETVGVAGTMSFVNRRYAAPGRQVFEVAGVPADLTLGLLIGGLSLTGYLGEHASHGHNISNGLIAAYAVRMGSIWGEGARQTHERAMAPAASPTAQFSAPSPGATSGSSPSPQVSGNYDWAR